MRKIMSAIFVLFLAAILSAAVVSPASAAPWIGYVGAGVNPWYEDVDFTVSVDLGINTTQYQIYDEAEDVYRLLLHLNYTPNGDEMETAVASTVVGPEVIVQVWDPINEMFFECQKGGELIVPAFFVQTNGDGVPYFAFNIAFQKYDNYTGEVLDSYPAVPPIPAAVTAYYRLDLVTAPPPASESTD